MGTGPVILLGPLACISVNAHVPQFNYRRGAPGQPRHGNAPL
jgi:hypothetical protein